MRWEDALEIVVAETTHERFRWLCSDENPNELHRHGCRAAMVRKASGQPEPELATVEAYPPLAQQARSLGRSLAIWLKSGLTIATKAEVRRRRAICWVCPHFDLKWKRCRKCGCSGILKPYLATEHCPDVPPRW